MYTLISIVWTRSDVFSQRKKSATGSTVKPTILQKRTSTNPVHSAAFSTIVLF